MIGTLEVPHEIVHLSCPVFHLGLRRPYVIQVGSLTQFDLDLM